jgi:phosphatidate cytidylyltransferase
MKKLIPRLMIFCVGLPLIVLFVLFLPMYNHLAINIAVVVFSAVGALEFAGILKKKNLILPPAEAAVLGALSPAAMTLAVSFQVDAQIVPAVFIAATSWILISRVFARDQTLADFTGRAAAGFAVMAYPGLFMEWIIRLGAWRRAEIFILTFLLIVFANDSLAWTAGMLFGKGNRGIVPVSPNKSIAGFIGGLTASALVGAGAVLLFPGVFPLRRFPALPSGIVLGLLPGIAGSLGDLGESAMKRSSGIKDSGFLIPGRGGVLDSIDSLALAAPVFYVVCRFLFF